MAAGGLQYGGWSPSLGPTAVRGTLQNVADLHNLDERNWSFKRYEMSLFSPACKVSYNSTRKVLRVRMSFRVPLLQVMMHFLYPPYGYRSTKKNRVCRVEIIEELGKDAAIVYSEGYEQTHMLFPVAVRDVVALQALQFLSPRVAIFNSKTVEHSSRPPRRGVYRINAPLAGFYFEQEGDKTRVEAYVSDMDMGGDIGRVKSSNMIQSLTRKMSKIARSLPGDQGQPPPYRLALANGGLPPSDFSNLGNASMPILLGHGLGHPGLELVLAKYEQDSKR